MLRADDDDSSGSGSGFALRAAEQRLDARADDANVQLKNMLLRDDRVFESSKVLAHSNSVICVRHGSFPIVVY